MTEAKQSSPPTQVGLSERLGPLPAPAAKLTKMPWNCYSAAQMLVAMADARALEREACADYVLTQAMACPADSATRATLESVSAVLRLYGPNVAIKRLP
jgi:hypothetical protein